MSAERRSGGSPAAERTAGGVRTMFDRVAPRYDLTNTVISLGQDRGWRTSAARATRLAPGETAIDVACGTGALTRTLARLEPNAHVIGADFAWEMVRRAPRERGDKGVNSAIEMVRRAPRERGAKGVNSASEMVRRAPRERGVKVAYLAGDATRLPLPNESADVVTIAFGLRNLPDPDAGLREFRRVLRPGGRLVICEFSTPTAPVFSTVYDRYLSKLIPVAAKAVSSDSEAYAYLARSIDAWPDQPGLARRMRRAGFVDVAWRNLTGGVVALHRGMVTG
jgi:demethylmenaquinone methyltransferase/2-methoxy-6-polyprenyl-1,4-benzoquinol methylase